MTEQLPLAIAQLLIKCTPALGATSHDDATAMTLVLHPYTNTGLAFENQQDTILILGHIARGASRAFPVSIFLFLPRTQLLERALEVLSEGTSLGGTSVVCSQPTGGLPGGETRKLRSGMEGRRWKGDSTIALSSESTS